MNSEVRWMLGGVTGAMMALVGWILFAQAGTDGRQDAHVASVKEQSVSSDARQDQVLERISITQTETAVALREVATTLRLIDERGTQAMLRDREANQ